MSNEPGGMKESVQLEILVEVGKITFSLTVKS